MTIASKVRVYDLAKQLNRPNKDIMDVLASVFNTTPKSHSSSIDGHLADKVIAHFKEASKPQPPKAPEIFLRKGTPPPPKPVAPPVEKKPEVVAEVKPVEASVVSPPTPPSPPEPVAPVSTVVPPVEAEEEKSPVSPTQTVTEPVLPPAPSGPRPAVITPAAQAGARIQALHNSSSVAAPPKSADISSSNRQAQADANHNPVAPKAPVNTVPPNLRKSVPTQTRVDTRSQAKERQLPDARRGKAPERREEKVEEDLTPTEVQLDDKMTVMELAQLLHKRETDIIKHVFMKGVMVTVNQTLDPAFAKTIAQELGFIVIETEKKEKEYEEYRSSDAFDKKQDDQAEDTTLKPRAPVVSIMGHVDHGKTSLLDAIRAKRQKIVDTEAGGITQSIGAYTVERDGQTIVFLDTPGHEAFTAMRMRGAKSTDIAILVVAADDGVMPQTIEAINHAKAAEIPIIVAVNKIDKADADPERVLGQLIDHGLTAEDWGGDTLVAKVSALQKEGIDDLLDQILLVAELLNLKANPKLPAEGIIIEAQLDKKRGPIATALVQSGTLAIGDNLIMGPVGGRVRALLNDKGERIESAGPATPVEILGLNRVPKAGDRFKVITDEKVFKQLLQTEKNWERENRIERRQIVPGLMIPQEDQEHASKDLNFIVKADTQGSCEAVNDSLSALSNDEITIKILHSGTGDISEADVMLASASQAIIIGFNVVPDNNADASAKRDGVMIRQYDVIYHIVDDVEKIMVGQLAPDLVEQVLGQAEVREQFRIGKSVIAGCMVQEGKITRSAQVLVIRGGQEIFKGALDNLKRFKEDVKEVAAGYECGVSIARFNDLQTGDILRFVTTVEKQRTLESVKRSASPSS